MDILNNSLGVVTLIATSYPSKNTHRTVFLASLRQDVSVQ